MEDSKNNMSSDSGMSYPNQSVETEKAMASISSLIKENQNLLPVLRREFRGEALQQYDDGSYAYVQVSKPCFVEIDSTTEKPLRHKVNYKDTDGKEYEKEIFVANDEAIEELLSIFKSMGINQITILTNIDEGTILDDLKEFECKLAALLGLKQKAWGIDKAMLPMLQMKIKTIIQDARYLCCNGGTIKAIQKTVQRVEQSYEGEKKPRRSPFS